MREKLLGHNARLRVVLALACLLLSGSGCAVRRETRVPVAQLPPPAIETTIEQLVARVNAQSEVIRTLVATVDFAPTAGSVYSGVIKEYRDVKGFILISKPAMIRMIGQAPVVRTNIFDMVSDGQEFRLYIPPKQKFIVGKNALQKPAKNALENMRPQHILDALLIPPLGSAGEKYVIEEAEENGRRFYVVSVLESSDDGQLSLKRKVWFERSEFEIVRQQIYGPGGAYLEDVRYADRQDFQGVRFPTHIEVTRPIEDYRLSIIIEKATFNQPIAPEKFDLKKPDSAQLIELGEWKPPEEPRGQ